MSIVIGTTILFVIVVLVCLAINAMSKKQTKLKTAELLHQFNNYGSKHQLSFSSQEVLTSAIIGLDGINKKILILLTADGAHQFELIDLQQVKSCSVITNFRSISIDEWKGRNIQEYYETIALQFEMTDHEKPIAVPFYNARHNDFSELRGLEQKAKDWETILSKMIYQRSKKIA